MGHAELQPEDIDETITPLFAAVKRTWYAFCDTTSIHGLKYAKDEETNKYVRFIWILITLIMFICAIAMVFTFYLNYSSNPTRMNVENDHTPISSTIFPPTTICPTITYNIQKTRTYLEKLTLPKFTSVSDILKILDIHGGFMYDGYNYGVKELNLMENLLLLNNLTILEFVRKINWSCNDIIYRCRYNDEIVACEKLFQVSTTFMGYCCSFNLNQTFLNFTNIHARPGLRNGLSVILYYSDSTVEHLSSYLNGFKVLIQETGAFPSAHSISKFVPLNEEVFLTVRPTEIFSSQAVKDLSYEERKCVFPHEAKLTFFPIYVGSNCEINCRIKMMLKFCNCYTYFLFFNMTNDRICTYKDIPCLVHNFAEIIGRYKKSQCNCSIRCEKILYDVSASSAPLQLEIPTVDSFYDDIKENYSVVHIYVNSQVFRCIRHDLLSNMVTLVSNLGSAFSLFVGMSMVSVVEIIYYFSIILKKIYHQECKARQMLFEKKIQKETGQENIQKKNRIKDIEK